MTTEQSDGACTPSFSSAELERKSPGLACFIEQVGWFELKPYQREMIHAIERGEKLMIDPATMREPYREWKQRYEEYLAEIVRSNAIVRGVGSNVGLAVW